MSNLFKWILFNGAFALLLYVAFVENVEGAENIILVIAWLEIIFSLLYFSDETMYKLAKNGRAVTPTVNVFYDITVSIVLAWYGHQILAVFWIIRLLIQEAAWSHILKKIEQKNV